jgi:hypothetical protein
MLTLGIIKLIENAQYYKGSICKNFCGKTMVAVTLWILY